MRQNQLEPDVISYSAAMSACEKGAQWEQASSLFQADVRSRLEPDVISYNAAISRVRKGEQWEQASALLQRDVALSARAERDQLQRGDLARARRASNGSRPRACCRRCGDPGWSRT